MKSFRYLFALILALFTCTVLATPEYEYGIKDPKEFEADLEEARAVYLDAARDGSDKRKVRTAIKHMKKLANKYPKHPLAMIYKGCSLAQRGRDEGARPLDRMRETEEGMKYIDRGLKIMASNKTYFLAKAEGQLLAGFLYVHLPDTVFHRLKFGNHLIQKLLKDPRFDEFPVGMQGAIYYAAAISAEKYGKKAEQKEYLLLSLKTNPDGDDVPEIKAKLKEL